MCDNTMNLGAAASATAAETAESDVAAPDCMVPETKSKRREREKQNAKRKVQPPYAVIVENDELHTFQYVIELLQKVFGYAEEKAFILTSQVHYSGQAIVWSGALELAELKRDLIRGYGPDNYATKPVTFPLGVRIEQLPG
jgi:ATP-dependent Clp protease adaptor protein ClpS